MLPLYTGYAAPVMHILQANLEAQVRATQPIGQTLVPQDRITPIR